MKPQKLICFLAASLLLTACTTSTYVVDYNKLEMAQKYADIGSNELAEKYFDEHFSGTGTNCSDYIVYLRYLIDNGKLQKAQEVIKTVPADCKDNVQLRLAEADLLLTTDNLRQAYQILINLPENDAAVLKSKGRLYMQMENYEEAIRMFNKSLLLDPMQKDVIGYLEFINSKGN